MIDERELIRRAQKLIRRYDNMKIVGSRGEWSGNARQGFNFNPLDGSGGGGGGGGIVIQTGACCLDGECFQTTQVNCVLQGGTYQGNGTLCSSVTVDCTQETSGACCVGENCSIETPQHCLQIGGIYQGDNTDCDPNPCTNTGACCHGDVCTIETQSDCEGSGGAYQGDNTTCDPNPCEETGACCIGSTCTIQTPFDCATSGGTYLGANVPCTPNLCLCPCMATFGYTGANLRVQITGTNCSCDHEEFISGCSGFWDFTDLPHCNLSASFSVDCLNNTVFFQGSYDGDCGPTASNCGAIETFGSGSYSHSCDAGDPGFMTHITVTLTFV